VTWCLTGVWWADSHEGWEFQQQSEVGVASILGAGGWARREGG